MPLGRIVIEQTLDAWIAEVEAGGIAARCRVLRAADADAIFERARATYRELAGLEDAPRDVPGDVPGDASEDAPGPSTAASAPPRSRRRGRTA